MSRESSAVVSHKLSVAAADKLDEAARAVRRSGGPFVSRVAQVEELVAAADVLAITRTIAKRKNGRKGK